MLRGPCGHGASRRERYTGSEALLIVVRARPSRVRSVTLGPGVRLHLVRTDRFTTTFCRVALHRDLALETTATAVLAPVLRSATAKHPTREALAHRLAEARAIEHERVKLAILATGVDIGGQVRKELFVVQPATEAIVEVTAIGANHHGAEFASQDFPRQLDP